ncbi:MAG: YqeG family HAD IIIA-type phosphatase [Bacilli bacterium]|nr:YqeG family HAD IIIA-type phosphatase [Bacilli bacterium]
MKKYVPFAHAKNLYEIEPDFFKSNGVTILLCDLDNTLDSYKRKTPTDEAIALINKFKEAGINVVVLSNNKYERVKTYADGLGVEFTWSTGKPFARKINKFIEEKGWSKENIMLVGDQLMTDVIAGKRAKIRTILTEKLVKEDQPVTRINRLFDRPIRKHLNKKGLLVDWREKYGTR